MNTLKIIYSAEAPEGEKYISFQDILGLVSVASADNVRRHGYAMTYLSWLVHKKKSVVVWVNEPYLSNLMTIHEAYLDHVQDSPSAQENDPVVAEGVAKKLRKNFYHVSVEVRWRSEVSESHTHQLGFTYYDPNSIDKRVDQKGSLLLTPENKHTVYFETQCADLEHLFLHM